MIVITTPTGTIGKQALDHVLKAGESVCVIVSDPTGLALEGHKRVEVIKGSTDDAEVVNKAFAGASAVFWVVPLDEGADNLERHYYKFNKIAADAIKAQNVQRITA
ncbi:NAD(P)H-binding protein [Ktedonosporobacter rubrisoli]|nr:NAD(P)H-binding protein [Ktedonosporobacter rubrisoli]